MLVLSQGECVILDAFMSEPFVEKLIGYLCLEEKKGSDHFSKSRMTVFVVRNCLYCNVVNGRTSCPSFLVDNTMCGHCVARGDWCVRKWIPYAVITGDRSYCTLNARGHIWVNVHMAL